MTLYRLTYDPTDNFRTLEMIEALVNLGWLVPVVPCEHGNTGKHAVVSASYAPEEQRATKWDIKWCDGE